MLPQRGTSVSIVSFVRGIIKTQGKWARGMGKGKLRVSNPVAVQAPGSTTKAAGEGGSACKLSALICGTP